jgi:hypothetical protein
VFYDWPCVRSEDVKIRIFGGRGNKAGSVPELMQPRLQGLQ